VTGFVNPRCMVTRPGARVDDVLVLTKPLGIGVITTAVQLTTTLNREAAEATVKRARRHGRHRLRPVLEHLREMLLAGGVGARIAAGHIR
jgi:selenide,water dikinase